MKQTAVEWLVEKYELVGILTPPMIERAKSMEREQIKRIIDEYHSSLFFLKLNENELDNITALYYNKIKGVNQ